MLPSVKKIQDRYRGLNPKEVVSTFRPQLIDYRRRMGNTTRQIDFAIQKLFAGKVVVCIDHYNVGEDSNANAFLLKKIVSRLSLEHPRIGYVVNMEEFSIQLR